MELLFHIFGHMLGKYPLTYALKKKALYMVGTSNKSDPEMAIDILMLQPMLHKYSQIPNVHG